MERENGRKMRLNQTVISIPVSISMIRSMVMDNLTGKVEITMLATTSMTKGMVMVKCIGTMEPST